MQTKLSESIRNEAYSKIKSDLAEKQKIVYDLISNYPDGISNKQIAFELGFPINSITGRVTELKNMGLIEFAGYKEIPNYDGKLFKNSLWRIV